MKYKKTMANSSYKTRMNRCCIANFMAQNSNITCQS